MIPLKSIEIPGLGTYICGRKKSELIAIPRFSTAVIPAQTFHNVDAIRAAAASMKPIYAAVENLLGNDRWGDCTCAAALKIQAIFDAASDQYRAPQLADAAWLYSQVTNPAFDPDTGANDNGAALQTVIAKWQSSGLYQDGHGKIRAAYAVDATKPDEVRAAFNSFGLLYVGCDLPPAWGKITGTGFTWPMDGPPDPNAGHCTFWYGYNDTGVFDGTWGMEGTIPWDAVAYYFGGQTGEVYAVVAA